MSTKVVIISITMEGNRATKVELTSLQRNRPTQELVLKSGVIEMWFPTTCLMSHWISQLLSSSRGQVGPLGFLVFSRVLNVEV